MHGTDADRNERPPRAAARLLVALQPTQGDGHRQHGARKASLGTARYYAIRTSRAGNGAAADAGSYPASGRIMKYCRAAAPRGRP